MGISIEEKDETIYVHGKGLHGLSKPEETLDVATAVQQPALFPVFLPVRILILF